MINQVQKINQEHQDSNLGQHSISIQQEINQSQVGSTFTIELQLSNNQVKRSKRSKYQKVPLEKKQQLIQMVQRENKKIKEAAAALSIKYATAKTIIFHDRTIRRAKTQQGQRTCRIVKKSQQCQLSVQTKIGSQIIKQINYRYIDKEWIIV